MGTLVVLVLVLSIVLALLIGGQALFVGALRGTFLLVLAAAMAADAADPFDTGGGFPVPASA